jgi:hypothetical protein
MFMMRRLEATYESTSQFRLNEMLIPSYLRKLPIPQIRTDLFAR